MQEYAAHVLSLLSEHFFPVAFVAPLFGGETAVLALAFLAGQGTFSLLSLILGSALGMICLDIAWFLLMRYPISAGVERWVATSPKYLRMQKKINTFAHHNDVLILFISKILIGTRVLILAYLGMRNIRFVRFVIYDSIATLLWAIILGCIGYFSGRGYISAADAYDSLVTGAFVLLLLVGIFYAALIATRKWILRS